MEYALGELNENRCRCRKAGVLILVVMEYALGGGIFMRRRELPLS